MMGTPSRGASKAETVSKITVWRIRSQPDRFVYVPPIGSFARRTAALGRRLCATTSISCCDAIEQALIASQQRDMRYMVLAMVPSVRRFAWQFPRLEENELLNEVFVDVAQSVSRNYAPPNGAPYAVRLDSLRAYLKTPVYRTALTLMYGRTTTFLGGAYDDETLAALQDEVDFESEIANQEHFDVLMASMAEEDHRRITAILQADFNLKKAARILGILYGTLRRWWFDFRRRFNA